MEYSTAEIKRNCAGGHRSTAEEAKEAHTEEYDKWLRLYNDRDAQEHSPSVWAFAAGVCLAVIEDRAA